MKENYILIYYNQLWNPLRDGPTVKNKFFSLCILQKKKLMCGMLFKIKKLYNIWYIWYNIYINIL